MLLEGQAEISLGQQAGELLRNRGFSSAPALPSRGPLAGIIPPGRSTRPPRAEVTMNRPQLFGEYGYRRRRITWGRKCCTWSFARRHREPIRIQILLWRKNPWPLRCPRCRIRLTHSSLTSDARRWRSIMTNIMAPTLQPEQGPGRPSQLCNPSRSMISSRSRYGPGEYPQRRPQQWWRPLEPPLSGH